MDSSMKIETSQLSKDTLLKMLEGFRPKPITDKMVAALLRQDLIVDIKSIYNGMEKLGTKIDSSKVTFRSLKKKIMARNKLVDSYNRLNKKGNKKIELLREIDESFQCACDSEEKETGKTCGFCGLVIKAKEGQTDE